MIGVFRLFRIRVKELMVRSSMSKVRKVKKPVIKSSQVVKFWDVMGDKYDFSVHDKRKSGNMDRISRLLDMIGVQDRQAFMENYTTTLGDDVYIPFSLGKGRQREMVNQIITCVHEVQHVLQYRRNPMRFFSNYALSDAARTHYEVDAYRTNMEIWYYLKGTILSPRGLSKCLEGYGVSKGDIHVAEKHLRVSAKLLKHGVIVSGVSKDAIKIMRRMGIRGNRVLMG